MPLGDECILFQCWKALPPQNACLLFPWNAEHQVQRMHVRRRRHRHRRCCLAASLDEHFSSLLPILTGACMMSHWCTAWLLHVDSIFIFIGATSTDTIVAASQVLCILAVISSLLSSAFLHIWDTRLMIRSCFTQIRVRQTGPCQLCFHGSHETIDVQC